MVGSLLVDILPLFPMHGARREAYLTQGAECRALHAAPSITQVYNLMPAACKLRSIDIIASRPQEAMLIARGDDVSMLRVDSMSPWA